MLIMWRGRICSPAQAASNRADRGKPASAHLVLYKRKRVGSVRHWTSAGRARARPILLEPGGRPRTAEGIGCPPSLHACGTDAEWSDRSPTMQLTLSADGWDA